MPRTEQRSERALYWPRAAGKEIGARPCRAGTTLGARIRAPPARDARMQCARALRDAFDAACASLCKDTADAAAQFIRAPRREGDVRVAVVRAGFCGRCRGVAAAALASALHRANVKALRVEDRWQLNDDNEEEAAVVVARAEATGAAGLRTPSRPCRPILLVWSSSPARRGACRLVYPLPYAPKPSGCPTRTRSRTRF